MKKMVEQALLPYKPGTGQVDPEPEKNDGYMPTIYAIGCGGAGCKAIQKIHEKMIPGIVTVAVDTDRGHLSTITAQHTVPIGDPTIAGHGAGGFPLIGKKAAEESSSEISARITSPDYVFIVTGLGGGTGTGAAPVIAQIAQDRGALVIVFCFWPFRVEKAREPKAEGGVKNLLSTADSVILLDNNKLSSYLPGLSLDQAFSVMNELVAETIAVLVDLFTAPPMDRYERGWEAPSPFFGLIEKSGIGVLLAGESFKQNKAESVVRDCLSNPLADIDYQAATGSFIHIASMPGLTLLEADEIATSLTFDLSPHTIVVWGACVRNDLKGEVRVFALMTGLKMDGVQFLNS